jgi:hypothetical protein
LEVHVPKAAQSLREFAIELMTIVVGILIAIGLDLAVEAIHWHHKVKIARESLRQELQEADEFYAFRIAVHECVARRLSLLNEIAESAAGHKDIEPVGDLTLHIGHLLTDDAWQSERAAQSLVHFPAAERERYSSTYGQQSDIRSWVNQEIAVWSAIRILEGNPNRLSPSDFTVIRQNIQIARALNHLIAINAGDQLSRASALGLSKANAQAEEVREACAPLKRAAPSIPFTNY